MWALTALTRTVKSMARKKPNSPLRSVFVALLIVLLPCVTACSLEELAELKAKVFQQAVQDDLDLAMEALKSRDIGDAEMYFERYLRKNPSGEERWEVWQELMDIALNVRQDKAVVRDYLEIMLAEYADDPVRRADIQMRLASLCNEMRLYKRAIALWEDLIADEDFPENLRAAVYRDLSRAYLRRLETVKAEQILNLCLELDVPASLKAECLFDLAETQSLTGEFKASEKSLQNLLDFNDLPEEWRVMATFMLADVLEQQDRLDEAARHYESIRESYPNPKVVEIRLNNLRTRKANPLPVPRPLPKSVH